MFRFLSVVPVLVTACGFLFGQTFTGSISGIVTDPTGAVISGATVTVTDLARNVNYRTVSNDTGFYMVSELSPGTYRVAAEQAGFRRFVLEPLPPATQQKATVNIRLDLGQVSEQIIQNSHKNQHFPGRRLVSFPSLLKTVQAQNKYNRYQTSYLEFSRWVNETTLS